MLNYINILFWTGACLGSRDTSAKVRCSAPAWCVYVGCAVSGALSRAAGTSWVTSFSEVTAPLPPQPAKTVHLSSCQADGLHACRKQAPTFMQTTRGLVAVFHPVQIHWVAEYVQHPARLETSTVLSRQYSAGIGTQNTLLEWPPSSFLSLWSS